MTKPWTRDDTKFWISQLENRIEDIAHYMKQTTDWCEEHDVYNDQQIFACMSMTVVWVSHMRGEKLSKREVFEILGIRDWDTITDDIEYSLSGEWEHYDLEELLEEVIDHF
jgi:hypothetical protein